MRRGLGWVVLVGLIFGAGWLVQRGAEERAVRRVLADVEAAVLRGLSRRDVGAIDGYFATLAEGAQPAGLAETQAAYQAFVTQLPADNAVQFHSFDLLALEVHEEAGLANVTYRLHFSVIRGGQALFSARVTQILALLKTPRGWRIMGGDAPQLEDVNGSWPPA